MKVQMFCTYKRKSLSGYVLDPIYCLSRETAEHAAQLYGTRVSEFHHEVLGVFEQASAYRAFNFAIVDDDDFGTIVIELIPTDLLNVDLNKPEQLIECAERWNRHWETLGLVLPEPASEVIKLWNGASSAVHLGMGAPHRAVPSYNDLQLGGQLAPLARIVEQLDRHTEFERLSTPGNPNSALLKVEQIRYRLKDDSTLTVFVKIYNTGLQFTPYLAKGDPAQLERRLYSQAPQKRYECEIFSERAEAFADIDSAGPGSSHPL